MDIFTPDARERIVRFLSEKNDNHEYITLNGTFFDNEEGLQVADTTMLRILYAYEISINEIFIEST